jgi:hypothetical protein
VATTACDRVDKVTIAESADTTLYDSPDTERPCGFGMRIADPELPGMAAQGTAIFAEAVQLVADSLGVDYARLSSYNPADMAVTFTALQKMGDLQGGRSMPGFRATMAA